MCYKPSMQKWSRDRNRRRPRSKEKAQESKPTQAPLQPAYFDAAPAAVEPHQESAPIDVTPNDDAPAFEPGNVAETSESTPSATPGQAAPRRRRRRSRGGKGKRSSSQPPPAAVAPADDAKEPSSDA